MAENLTLNAQNLRDLLMGRAVTPVGAEESSIRIVMQDIGVCAIERICGEVVDGLNNDMDSWAEANEHLEGNKS